MSTKKSSHKSGGRSSAASWSHFNKPIPNDGKPHGNSRRPGDASPEVQQLVVASILRECAEQGLSKKDAAYVLAIARHESGFNPDAASPRSSATGIGQFIDRTGKAYDLDEKNRFDIDANAKALVEHYVDTKNLVRSRGLGPEYIYKFHHDGPSGNSGGLEIARREVMPYVNSFRDSPLMASYNNSKDGPKIQYASYNSTKDSPTVQLASFTPTRDSPKVLMAKAEPAERKAPAVASDAPEKASRPTVAAPAQKEQPAPLSALETASVGSGRPVAQVTAEARASRQAEPTPSPLTPLQQGSLGSDRTVSQVAVAGARPTEGSKQAAAPLPPSSPASSGPNPRVAAALPYADTPAGLAPRVAPGESLQPLSPSSTGPDRTVAQVTADPHSRQVEQALNSLSPLPQASLGADRNVAQVSVGAPEQGQSMAQASASLTPLTPASTGPDRAVAQVTADPHSRQVEQALNALSPLPQASLGADQNVAQVSVGAPGQPESVRQASAPLTPLSPASLGPDQRVASVTPEANTPTSPALPAAQEATRGSGAGYNKEEILAAGKAQDLHPSAVAAVVAHRTGETMTADAVLQAWNSSPSLTPGSPGADRAFAQGPAGGQTQPESAAASAPLSPLTPVNLGADRQVAQVSAGAPGQPESATASGPLSPLTPANVGGDRQVAQVTAGVPSSLDSATSSGPLSPLTPTSASAGRQVAQVTVGGPSQPESASASGPLSPLTPASIGADRQVAQVTAGLSQAEGSAASTPLSPLGSASPGADRAVAHVALDDAAKPVPAPSVQAPLSSLEAAPSQSSQPVANVVADSLGPGESIVSPNAEAPPAAAAEKTASSQASVQEALQALSSVELTPSGEITSDSLEKGKGTFFETDRALDQSSGFLSASAGSDRQEQAAEEHHQEVQVAAAEMEMDMGA